MSAPKPNSALASAFDAVVEGSDIAASMERLMDDFDDDLTANTGSMISPWGIGFGGSGSSAANTGSDMPDLITPDMFMQIPATASETTSVAGVSTASIWSNLGATSAVPAVTPQAEASSSPSKRNVSEASDAEAQPLTLQELEARLHAKSAALPPALARAAPSNSAPLAAQAPPPTVKPTGKPNAWGAPPAKPATPNDGAETHVVTSASPASWKGDATPGAVGTTQGTAPASAHKTTPPILKQLQHAQGQHAIQQKLTTERQRLDAEMKRLETQLQGHRQALTHHHQHAHAARMQAHAATTAAGNGANTGQGPDEAELHRLADVVQTHVRAASDIERTCDALVQAQIAANQAFEKFHLTLMIDHGHGEQQRAVLDQRKSQLVAQLQAHVQGLRQLDKHMAQLQHRYGSMLVQAPPTQGAPPAHNGALVELRNQIQATAHHHATAIKQHTMLEGQLAHADVLLAMLSQSSGSIPRGDGADSTRYDNLMSWSEKKWLIKIQAKQMYSENPYVDDFYAHAVARKRAAQMRAAALQAGAPLPSSLFPTGPAPMGKHKRDKVHAGDAKHEYAPTHFDHALGSVRGTNIRAPQKLIAVPTAPNAAPDTDGPDEKSRENAEKAKRRKVLLLIEQGYRHLLQAEDRSIKLETPTLSVRARGEIDKERAVEVAAVMRQFQIAPADQTIPAADDAQFWRIIAYPKGQKLLARLVQFCNPAQVHAVLQLLLRNMVALVTPPHHAPHAATPLSASEHEARLESMSAQFLPAVAQALEAVGADVIVACMRTAVERHVYDDDNNKRRMFHKFCAALVYTVCRRADTLLGAGAASPPVREQWTALVEQFIATNVSTLAALITTAAGVDEVVHLWVFANILASHSGPACRASMHAALGAAAEITPDHPVVRVFLQLTGKPGQTAP